LMAPFNAIKDMGILFGSMLKPLKLLPKMLKGFAAGLLGALVVMIQYLLIAAAIVIGLIALKKGFDLVVDNLDVIKQKLSDFGDAVMAIPGKIGKFFEGIFVKIQNFFIDAINGVIDLINKFKPGKDIEKLERVVVDTGEDTKSVEVAPPGADPKDLTPGEQDAAFQSQANILTAGEEQDNAFNVTPQEEGGGFFDKFKSFFKSKPANNEYMPVDTQTQSGGNTIIDNSVKTSTSNNQTQSIGISSRNDDATIFRTSDIAV